MMVDTVRAIATYSIAFVVVVGGGAIIYLASGDPNATDTVAIIAGFVGAALTFTFSSEVQTRTARQAATATAVQTASAERIAYATNGNGNAAKAAAATQETARHTADIAESSATIAENTSP